MTALYTQNIHPYALRDEAHLQKEIEAATLSGKRWELASKVTKIALPIIALAVCIYYAVTDPKYFPLIITVILILVRPSIDLYDGASDTTQAALENVRQAQNILRHLGEESDDYPFERKRTCSDSDKFYKILRAQYRALEEDLAACELVVPPDATRSEQKYAEFEHGEEQLSIQMEMEHLVFISSFPHDNRQSILDFGDSALFEPLDPACFIKNNGEEVRRDQPMHLIFA